MADLPVSSYTFYLLIHLHIQPIYNTYHIIISAMLMIEWCHRQYPLPRGTLLSIWERQIIHNLLDQKVIHTMEKNQGGTGNEKLPGWGWVLAILRVVRAGLVEKVKFDQRPLGGESESCKYRQEGHNGEKS